MTFTVSGGRLRRDGAPFVAFGVDYHPSDAGCRWWSDWNESAVRDDFHRMAAAGLNSVRFFLFWRDFMPDEQTVSHAVLARLEAAVAAAGEAGLACVLSLLTIWMNGQRLDLPWREGRSIWRDPAMLAAEDAYVRAVARTLRGHDNVLAYDLGDELWNIDPAGAATLTPDQVASWQGRLAAAIRDESPDALVLQANDSSAVFGNGPYGCDNQAELDLAGVHGFPPWTPGGIESTLSYKATSLPAFLVSVASAYRPALLDELGSYGVSSGTAASYLGAAAASALAAGANGLFVWCWQDIASTAEPYRERPAERFAGLHTLDGTAKPAMAVYRRVLDEAAALSIDRPPAPVALFLPRRMRGQGDSYLDAAGSTVPTFHSYLLLKRAHLDFEVVAATVGDTPRTGVDLVICPAPAQLTLDDLDALRRYAEGGATVYLSLGDHLHGLPGADMVGAEITDYQLDDRGKQALCWGDLRWPVMWHHDVMKPTSMAVTTGDVLAVYPDGSPAMAVQRVGRGRVVFTNLPVESQFRRPGSLTATAWHKFYLRLAELAGVRPGVTCSEPDLEVVWGRSGTVVINHGDRPVTSDIRLVAACHRVSLNPKDWTVLPHDTTRAPARGPGRETVSANAPVRVEGAIS
ncbi:cellulase family glycosylhydrolase [Streptomyces silvisoli]|uniref:Cellulase family glycosylhydrolase n=1 Tax=Streptomyces silvisoli TaxID=3034235 RepID=A0ABT5ZST9_9ACTN|nr:cellulase family glycosylhydrolase [Streptomyces silvisoli]MDF3292660.1 cellulase family glycosylhydrolase [Streptomyces silvisoli]